MTKRVSRLQTGVGLGLLVVGIGFYAFHLWKGGPFDWDAKVALGFAGAGLLLLPFDLSTAREAVKLWRERKSGTGGP